MRGNRIATADLWRGERASPLEHHLQHESIVRLVHHMAHGIEFLGGVATNETMDLDQIFIGEPNNLIGLFWTELCENPTCRAIIPCVISSVRLSSGRVSRDAITLFKEN